MNPRQVYAIAKEWLTATVLVAVSAVSSAAQQALGTPPSQPAYRPPALALVQPAAGGSVPSDKPVLVFRFAPGEPNDPIDLGSFVVTVDGADRSALFQVTPAEAWGILGPLGAEGHPAAVVGSHDVAARICSTHGACSETSAKVVVTPAPSATKTSADRERSFLDVVLDIARKLLRP